MPSPSGLITALIAAAPSSVKRTYLYPVTAEQAGNADLPALCPIGQQQDMAFTGIRGQMVARNVTVTFMCYVSPTGHGISGDGWSQAQTIENGFLEAWRGKFDNYLVNSISTVVQPFETYWAVRIVVTALR